MHFYPTNGDLPNTVWEHLTVSGYVGYFCITMGLVLLILTIQALRKASCFRSHMLLLAISYIPFLIGLVGLIVETMATFRVILLNPTANGMDLAEGMYIAFIPILYASVLCGPSVALNLIGMAMRYKTEKNPGRCE